MSQGKGIREVGYFDCAGGGQVMVDGNYAYIGHITGPHGTTIVDVSDPKNPRKVWECEIPKGLHSHKARAANGILLVNHEVDPAVRVPELRNLQGGLGIYDCSDPSKTKLITVWKCPGSGIHRFTFDGRYAYISPTMEGYRNNIIVILDLKDPAKPEEVGRWWMPGQWEAGGEKPTWKGAAHRCHHPLRYGNRLYTSYWHGGLVILDIDDMRKPKFVSGLDWSPPFPWPTHTCLRIPFKIENRDLMVVTDEDVIRLEGCPPYPSAFLWIVDITDEKHPTPISTFQLDEIPPEEQPYMTGCHQPSEKVLM